MSGGDKTKKFETYGYIFRRFWHTKWSIIFFTPKSWRTPAIITRKLGLLVDSERVCAFVSRCREKNSKCRLTEVGVWERSPQSPKARAPPPAFGDFYIFFNKNNKFLSIFWLKFWLKNLFLISSIIQSD